MPTPTSKRTTAPSFQFYPSDFLASSKVDDMSMTERGIYITLLCKCWLDNGLPNDMRRLAKMVDMKQPQFERIWTNGLVSECFYLAGGKFHNKRLDVERSKQKANRQRQSDNAKARWDKGGTAAAMPSHPSGSPTVNARAESREEKSSDPVVVSSEEKKRAPEVDGQKDFMAFQAAYPANRRIGGYRAQRAYFDQLEPSGGPDALMTALANHIASEQWTNPKHIPNMDVWLTEERWRQRLDPPDMDGPSSKWEAQLPEWARKARAQKAQP